MKVNLNSYVTVKLTEHGRMLLYDRHNYERLNDIPSSPDMDKFMQSSSNEFRCQFWELMELFGDYVGVGNKPVFEDMNVEVEQADA